MTIISRTLGGGLAALVIGIFFSKPILGILASLGIEGFTMWQIGVFLGFLCGFFPKIEFTNQKEKKDVEYEVEEPAPYSPLPASKERKRYPRY
jgi:pilus assembly protein TadC